MNRLQLTERDSPDSGNQGRKMEKLNFSHPWMTWIITINQTVDYMARGFKSFMRGLDITRAIGRVGLKVEPVLGPEIALAVARAIWA